MNRFVLMTGVTGYLLGFGVYVIIFVSSNWGDTDYVMYKTMEGITQGLIWPYLLVEWLIDGTPMM